MFAPKIQICGQIQATYSIKTINLLENRMPTTYLFKCDVFPKQFMLLLIVAYVIFCSSTSPILAEPDSSVAPWPPTDHKFTSSSEWYKQVQAASQLNPNSFLTQVKKVRIVIESNGFDNISTRRVVEQQLRAAGVVTDPGAAIQLRLSIIKDERHLEFTRTTTDQWGSSYETTIVDEDITQLFLVARLEASARVLRGKEYCHVIATPLIKHRHQLTSSGLSDEEVVTALKQFISSVFKNPSNHLAIVSASTNEKHPGQTEKMIDHLYDSYIKSRHNDVQGMSLGLATITDFGAITASYDIPDNSLRQIWDNLEFSTLPNNLETTLKSMWQWGLSQGWYGTNVRGAPVVHQRIEALENVADGHAYYGLVSIVTIEEPNCLFEIEGQFFRVPAFLYDNFSSGIVFKKTKKSKYIENLLAQEQNKLLKLLESNRATNVTQTELAAALERYVRSQMYVEEAGHMRLFVEVPDTVISNFVNRAVALIDKYNIPLGARAGWISGNGENKMLNLRKIYASSISEDKGRSLFIVTDKPAYLKRESARKEIRKLIGEIANIDPLFCNALNLIKLVISWNYKELPGHYAARLTRERPKGSKPLVGEYLISARDYIFDSTTPSAETPSQLRLDMKYELQEGWQLIVGMYDIGNGQVAQRAFWYKDWPEGWDTYKSNFKKKRLNMKKKNPIIHVLAPLTEVPENLAMVQLHVTTTQKIADELLSTSAERISEVREARQKLLARGGGLIYDAELNITWLQDANYAWTKSRKSEMSWGKALAWAENLNYYDTVRGVTYDDWRLPTTTQPDPSCSKQSASWNSGWHGYGCIGSEMGHLYNVAAISVNSPGPFKNITSSFYWSGTETKKSLARRKDSGGNAVVWSFEFVNGYQKDVLGSQTRHGGGQSGNVWLVRDGDVAAVSKSQKVNQSDSKPVTNHPLVNTIPANKHDSRKSSPQNSQGRSIEHKHNWFTKVGTAGDWTHTHIVGINLERFSGTHSHPGNSGYGKPANNKLQKLLKNITKPAKGSKPKELANTRTVKQTDGSHKRHVYSSKVSRCFHRSDCVELKNISPDDRIDFPSREEATQEGAIPCDKCNS